MAIRKQYLLITPETSPTTSNLLSCLLLTLRDDYICSSDQCERRGNTSFFGEEASFFSIKIPFSKHTLSTEEPDLVLDELPLCIHECFLLP